MLRTASAHLPEYHIVASRHESGCRKSDVLLAETLVLRSIHLTRRNALFSSLYRMAFCHCQILIFLYIGSWEVETLLNQDLVKCYDLLVFRFS